MIANNVMDQEIQEAKIKSFMILSPLIFSICLCTTSNNKGEQKILRSQIIQ